MLSAIALEMDWSPQERHWLGWIRDIFFETGCGRGRRSESEFSARLKIKRDRIRLATLAARGDGPMGAVAWLAPVSKAVTGAKSAGGASSLRK